MLTSELSVCKCRGLQHKCTFWYWQEIKEKRHNEVTFLPTDLAVLWIDFKMTLQLFQVYGEGSAVVSGPPEIVPAGQPLGLPSVQSETW